MRELKVPGFYKHFKDKNYLVIGISQPTNIGILSKLSKEGHVMAIDSEDLDNKIPIYVDKDLNRYHNELWSKEPLVLYMGQYNYHEIYVRRLDMFLEKVDPERKDNIFKQEYRFEEITKIIN